MNKRGMVYYEGQLAGIVAETDEGYAFTYDTGYLNSGTAKPISLTLPLSKEEYTDKVLFAFFDGLKKCYFSKYEQPNLYKKCLVN